MRKFTPRLAALFLAFALTALAIPPQPKTPPPSANNSSAQTETSHKKLWIIGAVVTAAVIVAVVVAKTAYKRPAGSNGMPGTVGY